MDENNIEQVNHSFSKTVDEYPFLNLFNNVIENVNLSSIMRMVNDLPVFLNGDGQMIQIPILNPQGRNKFDTDN